MCHFMQLSFENFILTEELFAKTLWNLETYVLVNNNLCGKLFSSLELLTSFDEIFKATLVSFFIPDFNLFSCQLDNVTFKYYIESFFFYIILKENKFTIL